MRDEDIHIGDMVRVRQWEDMEEEFGLNEDGDIDLLFPFQYAIKKFCGLQFTVEEHYDGAYKGTLCGVPGHWHFTHEVLEPIIEDELCVADDEEIKLLFETGSGI